MKVIGVILNVIAALWAAFGVLLMLIQTDGYTMAENVLYASIAFYVPAAIVIAIGSLLVRAGNRRRRRREAALSDREYDRRFGEGGTYDPAFADYRDADRYGEPDRRRDTGFAPPDPGRRTDGERYDAYREPYDPYRDADSGRAIRDDFRGSGRSAQPERPASGLLTEAVCRSCGSRKTMRAGTSAPCDHCGSEMIAE